MENQLEKKPETAFESFVNEFSQHRERLYSIRDRMITLNEKIDGPVLPETDNKSEDKEVNPQTILEHLTITDGDIKYLLSDIEKELERLENLF